ncbi:MAG: serine hydrolase [Gemmatimonadaceae bacterium]|nr:serine hydrolase [Gemmatimonadaceae bacterium]
MLLSLILAATVGGGPGGVPVQSPRSVGMSAERLETIDRVVQRGITAGGYPGATVVIGRKGAAVWSKGYGRQAWGADSPAATPDRTIYDLASLTKVVATTTMAMILFDQGKLDLDAKVQTYLPQWEGRWKEDVTVRMLLTHRGGLPAGRDLWRITDSPDAARTEVLGTALVYRPGSQYIYSDLGADLLGMLCEAIAGERADTFLATRVFEPLGMTSTGFRPGLDVRERVAPTEVSPPRGYPVQGEVHDENAYALGGVAGHAGLFGTASDLAIFAQMMLNGGEYDGVRVVKASTVELFTQRAAGSRALGWEMAEGRHGAGVYLSPLAFGHVGFTGTSLWIDPARELFVILLTNRVHAARARRPATVIADVRSDLADAAALAVMDDELRVETMPVAFRADRAVNWNKPMRVRRSRRVRRARPTASASAKVRTTTKSKATPSKATPKKSTVKKPVAKKASVKKPTTKAKAGNSTPTRALKKKSLSK